MAWSNQNPNDAMDMYEYYKKMYDNAEAQKRESERQEQSFLEQKTAAITEKKSLTTQKLNFEERVRGIEEIIKMLEGSGGWFSRNVPETISKAKRSLTRADSSYRSSIRYSGGVGTASLETAFKVKSVEEDSHSAVALVAFKAEKTRLEEEIANLIKRIAALSEMISSLTKKINTCNDVQATLRSAMNEYANEMNRYRQYIY